jgi:hypothetical protein
MKQFNCKSWLARMLIGWGERGDLRCKGSNYFIMVGEGEVYPGKIVNFALGVVAPGN